MPKIRAGFPLWRSLCHRRRPGAEFGGTGKKFADQDFWMTFFMKNIHFHAHNFWWPFLVIKHGFRIFSIFLQIFRITLFSREKPLFSKNNSLITPFLYYLRAFARIRQKLLLKILGGRMHGPSPHLKFFGGPSPPVPLYRSPPVSGKTKRSL